MWNKRNTKRNVPNSASSSFLVIELSLNIFSFIIIGVFGYSGFFFLWLSRLSRLSRVSRFSRFSRFSGWFVLEECLEYALVVEFQFGAVGELDLVAFGGFRHPDYQLSFVVFVDM